MSGLVRQFKVVDFFPPHLVGNSKVGWGISIDGMIPIIPATPSNFGNALTINGSFQIGSGFNDQYTGLTGGVTYPAVPNPNMLMPAPTFTPNIDPGLVTYDPTGALHTVNWNSFLVGLQYYLPPAGNVFLSANFAQMKSDNIASYLVTPGDTPTAAQLASVFNKVQWGDVNLFWNVTQALRFGVEYAYFRETYADGVVAPNHRGQFSGYYVF